MNPTVEQIVRFNKLNNKLINGDLFTKEEIEELNQLEQICGPIGLIQVLVEEIQTLKQKLSAFEGMTFSENQEITDLKHDHKIMLEALKAIEEFHCVCSLDDEVITNLEARKAISQLKNKGE